MPEVQIADEVEQMDIAVETGDARAYELARMRHSCAHLMAEAVQEIFPDARFGIGPAIEHGFYYDFDLPRALTPDDLGDFITGYSPPEAFLDPTSKIARDFNRDGVVDPDDLGDYITNAYADSLRP